MKRGQIKSSNKTRVVDNRNFKSKEFKEEASKRLISCLSEWGFQVELRPMHTILPTMKVVKDMITFMFHQLIPNLECTPFERKIGCNFVL